MDTYNPNKLTAKTPKSALTLRELADIDESAGDRNRVDNIRDNQVLVSLSKFNRPKTFSFRYISDILIGGNGVTISTDKDGITTISNSGVRKIIAGTNITISPVSGLGDVTINATGGGGGGYVPYVGATANVDLGEYELKAGQLSLDISPTGTAAVGTTRWNNTIGSSETTLKGGSVILKNGVDLVARVVNKVTPNTTLTKAAYQAVRVSGAAGQRLAVEFAQANNDANSADTIGLVTETIATNQEGFIMTVGNLEEINTTGSLQGETWADGDVLYLSPTTEGALTNIKPTGATGHIVVMGYVEYAHAIHGKIYVKIMNGWELDELHNVYITSPANNNVLTYESSTSLWKNKTVATALGYTPVPTTRSLTINGTTQDLSADRTFSVGTVTSVGVTAGTGISVSGSPITSSGSITVTNSAPDQVVAISAGTGIGVTGTYPNFTVTNSAPSSGGTVTSVAALTLGTTGTDLTSTVANGTTTPVITLNVPTASATNRGALSAADWITFNNKQNTLSLTTTGTSGPATLVGSTLNVPQYGGGGGGVSAGDAIAYAIALG